MKVSRVDENGKVVIFDVPRPTVPFIKPNEEEEITLPPELPKEEIVESKEEK